MFGWRGRIGLMLPARNLVMEPDLVCHAPEGVSIHTTRMRRDRDVSDISTNKGMLEYADEAAELLSQAGVDVAILGCTAASFVNGPGQDREIAQKLEQNTKIQVTTASTAVVEALKALGCNKLTIITPYIDEINAREVEFFSGNNFEILKIQGMGISQTSSLPKIMPENIYRFCKEHFQDGSEALFVSCTNFRAVEIIPFLEQDLKVPVITSNQASLWKALRMIGIRDRLPGCGILTES